MHVRETVPCAVLAREIPLDACVDCVDRVGQRDDPTGAASWVVCRRARGAHDPGSGEIARAMTPYAQCVRADVSVPALRQLLVDEGIDLLAVVDAHDRVLGAVTAHGLAARWLDGGPPPRSLAEVLDPDVATIGEQASLAQARALMSAAGASLLIVTATEGEAVGVLSDLDVAWRTDAAS